MDPYLEGEHWVSVHAELCIRLIDQIDEQLPDNYVVTPEKYLVVETLTETNQSYQPDATIKRLREIALLHPAKQPSEVLTPTLHVPVPQPRKYQQTFLKITELDTSDVVTVIELVSPGNKDDEGRTKFRRKRSSLHENGIHFLEIDLIRRGKRTIPQRHFSQIAPFDYLAALYRADATGFDVWTFTLADRIPLLPIPLMVGDSDVIIDTQAALDLVYRKRKFWKQIDYNRPSPPPKI